MYWFNFYVFVNILLLTLLAFNVSRLRMKERVSLGDGGKATLKNAIRSHANSVEHAVPFGLVVLALSLSHQVAPLPYLVCGFTLSRLLFSAGMLLPRMSFRRSGAGLTYLLELIALVMLGLSLL